MGLAGIQSGGPTFTSSGPPPMPRVRFISCTCVRVCIYFVHARFVCVHMWMYVWLSSLLAPFLCACMCMPLLIRERVWHLYAFFLSVECIFSSFLLCWTAGKICKLTCTCVGGTASGYGKRAKQSTRTFNIHCRCEWSSRAWCQDETGNKTPIIGIQCLSHETVPLYYY